MVWPWRTLSSLSQDDDNNNGTVVHNQPTVDGSTSIKSRGHYVTPLELLHISYSSSNINGLNGPGMDGGRFGHCICPRHSRYKSIIATY